MEETKRVDSSILYGPQLVGAKVRELLRGKYEVIPKTKEHIRVDSDKCIGMTCQICYITCPTGSLEMENFKPSLAFLDDHFLYPGGEGVS
jgi:NAD-dependent dihydropyrimidine dehydrogenase PreA subunit